MNLKYSRFFSMLLLILTNSLLYAQDGDTVSGTVSDELGPLSGASVVIKGTTNGVQTDFDGNYTIGGVPADAILEISYIGYATKDRPVDGQTTIDIILQEDAQALDEVVVVGYGTQQKEDITGSISVIDNKELTKQPNSNPLSSVQGKVSGVNITNSGRPGAAPNVRIRGVGSVGNADPLYVVDGVLTNNIQYLSSNDIKSISILKDASSAAIYGIRAANGVIVIETKRGGGAEDDVSFTYEGFAGIQRVTNIPQLVNRDQYIELFNEKQNFENSDGLLDPANFPADTDWFDEIIRKGAPTTSHNISISGNSKKAQYYLGFGYFDQEGILKAGNGINTGNDFRRLTGRAGLDIDLNDYFTFGGSVAYTDTQNNNASEPFFQSYIAPPLFNPINADGTYGFVDAIGNFGNPRATLDFSRQKSQGIRILANVYAEIKPIESLTIRTSFSGDYLNDRSFNYTPAFFVSQTQQSNNSNLNRTYTENDNWLWENTVNWTNTFGKHDLTLLGGFSQEERIFFTMDANVQEVPFNGDDSLLFLRLGNIEQDNVTDNGDKTHFQSLFARMQYKFDNKYLLNATIRRDGSSNFSNDLNTDIFPSVGIGWILSNESFLSESTFINSLKLKASWGKLGNAQVARGFDVTASDPTSVFFGVPQSSQVARSISQFSDPTIFWELVEEYDLGIEFTLLQNKLSGEINYYNRETSDAVFDITQLASSGATNTQLTTNAGSFKNTGVEVSLNWNDQISNDFTYSVYGNITTIQNEITDILGGSFLNTGPALFGNSIIRLEEGEAIGSYYGFTTDGVVQTQEEADAIGSTPGAFKFQDLNGDGIIGEDDKSFLGNPIPDFTYGFGFNLAYKMIDFAMDFNGVAGNEIYNFNKNSRFGNESWDIDFYNNRWTPGSGINDFPAPNSDQNSLRPSNFFVEKGDYFRIRNIQLGFTIPADVLLKENPFWDTLRLYINAQNPFTAFQYTGFSPELNGGGADNPPGGAVVNSGIDRNIYPIAATYNLGVVLKF